MESGPACLVLFSSFVRACFKGERGRGSICSFSILYRISLFPFPFAVVSVFTFFFFSSKNCVGFVFLFSSVLRHHNMPSFPSPRLSIRSLLPQRNLLPSRSPICISYRSVLYYTTYLYSKRLLYSNCHSAVFVFRNQGDVSGGTVYDCSTLHHP